MAEHGDSIQTGVPEELIATIEGAFTEARAESYRAGYEAGIEVGRSQRTEVERVNQQQLSDKYRLGERDATIEQRNHFIGILRVLGEKHPQIVPDLPIEVLDANIRAERCLEREEVRTLGELVLRTEDSLLEITNFGQRSLDEINEGLGQLGLSLKQPE